MFSLEAAMVRLFYGSELAHVLKSRNETINRTIRQIESGRAETRNGIVEIDRVVKPAESTKIERLTTDGKLLRSAFEEGRETAMAYIDGKVTVDTEN
jgi:hypothetical protein